MGVLRVIGTAIIFLTVIGFLIGIYVSAIVGSSLGAGLSVLGLIVGSYVGYLGVKVDELSKESFQGGGERIIPSLPELAARIQELERRAVAPVRASEEMARESSPKQKDGLTFDPPLARVNSGGSVGIVVSSTTLYEVDDLDFQGLPGDVVFTWVEDSTKAISEGRKTSLRIQTSRDTRSGIYPIQLTFRSHKSGASVTGIFDLVVR